MEEIQITMNYCYQVDLILLDFKKHLTLLESMLKKLHHYGIYRSIMTGSLRCSIVNVAIKLMICSKILQQTCQ